MGGVGSLCIRRWTTCVIIASERAGGFRLPCRICLFFGDGLGYSALGYSFWKMLSLLSRMHQRSLRKVKAGEI